MSITLFFIFLVLLLYTYLGYPIVLSMLQKYSSTRIVQEPDPIYSIPVSIIISCFNEETQIAAKIENTLQLHYSGEQMEIIVISDGSTDRTVEIAREYEDQGVRVIDEPARKGKTAVQNQAVKVAKNEIIIFSDADVMYQLDAVQKLVRHFGDNRVAGVGGEVIFTTDVQSSVSSQENLFRRYEKYIKRLENRFGNLIGFTGAIYAVRKSLYIPLSGAVISDFIESLVLARNGYTLRYEPEAIAVESVEYNYQNEYSRKMRTILRGLNGIKTITDILNPLRYGMLAFQVFSHKICRWGVPLFLIGLFFSNLLLLGSLWFNLVFGMQLLLYLFALLGWFFHANDRKLRIFSVPFYFVLVNYAALIALVKFIAGKNIIAWRPQR